jgi:hypothetical protein
MASDRDAGLVGRILDLLSLREWPQTNSTVNMRVLIVRIRILPSLQLNRVTENRAFPGRNKFAKVSARPMMAR